MSKDAAQLDAIRMKLASYDDPRAVLLFCDMLYLAKERPSYRDDFNSWIENGSKDELIELAKAFGPLKNNPPFLRAIDTVNAARAEVKSLTPISSIT